MSKKTVLIGAIASTLIAFSSAQAGDRLFHVNRASFDSSYGINETLRRIEDFAERSCIETGRSGLWVKRAQLECMYQVRAELIADIGDARLAAAAEATRFADNR